MRVSKSVTTSKLNIGYIAKHGAIIEYTLNVYRMYIEMLQNMVQYLGKPPNKE